MLLKKVLIGILFIAVMYSIPQVVSTFNNVPDITFNELQAIQEESSSTISEFMQNPNEEAIVENDVAISKASIALMKMEAHDTFLARLFRLDPVLTDKEQDQLADFRVQQNSLLTGYIQTIASAIYQAQEMDFYDVPESLYLSFEEGHDPPKLTIKGDFDVRDRTIFQRNYFLVRTPGQNYIIKRPSDYSVSFKEREATFRFENEHYMVEANILH